MILLVLVGLSAELTAGVGSSAPNRATEYGYKTWFNFFIQASTLKLPWAVEPYLRFQHQDHPEILGTENLNGVETGVSLKQIMDFYELGLDVAVFQRYPMFVVLSLGTGGYYCTSEKQVYGSQTQVITQVSPGLASGLRLEYRRDYHPWLDDKKVTMLVGLTSAFRYVNFRPDVWPLPDWFADVGAQVGVRW